MFKPLTFAAVLTAAAAVALPTFAADVNIANPSNPVVRIPIAGKTPAQLDAEIKAAVALVCVAAEANEATCVGETLRDARLQLANLTAAPTPAAGHLFQKARLDIVRGDLVTVRVKIAGKSAAQIDGEIHEAASKVCQVIAVTGVEYDDCVGAALDDAQRQLREIAQVAKSDKLAAN